MDLLEILKSVFEAVVGSNFALGAVIVLVLAKVVPNSKIKEVFYGFGTFVTLGMSSFGWYKKVEEWFIDGLAVAITSFIEGLRSDN